MCWPVTNPSINLGTQILELIRCSFSACKCLKYCPSQMLLSAEEWKFNRSYAFYTPISQLYVVYLSLYRSFLRLSTVSAITFTHVIFLLSDFKYCNSYSLPFNYLNTFSCGLQKENYRLISLHSVLNFLCFVALFFSLIRSTYMLVFMFLSMLKFVLLICVFISYKIP